MDFRKALTSSLTLYFERGGGIKYLPDKSKRSVEIEAELIVLKANEELNEAQLDGISGGSGAYDDMVSGDASAAPGRPGRKPRKNKP